MCSAPSIPTPPPPPQVNLGGVSPIRLMEPMKQATPKQPQVTSSETVRRRGKRGLVIPPSSYGVSIPGSNPTQ